MGLPLGLSAGQFDSPWVIYQSFFFTDKKADVFQCSWGDIPIAFQCDGNNNCGDNSDEENCNKGNIKSFK